MSELEIIDSLASFEGLRKEWNALLASSGVDTFFLTWEWLHAWWLHLAGKRRLKILALRDRELLAIAPLALGPLRLGYLAPFRSLEFLGAGIAGSDYLDLMVRRGSEERALEALSGYLARQNRMVELSQLRADSSMAALLAQRVQQSGWRISQTTTNVCPQINLRGHSWDSYLASLGADHRYNFRRRLKNLRKAFEVQFESVVSEEQRRGALDALVALHRKRWSERGGGSEAFQTPGFVAFHDEVSRLALERGWLRLYTLKLDGQPAASLYGFRYGATFSFYQSGFDPGYARHSVGLIMMGLAIQSALLEGVETFDLLHGAENYKQHWANQACDLIRLELYPPRLRGLVYKQALSLGRSARRLASHMLPEGVVRIVRATGSIT